MYNENLEKAILGYILLNESEELKVLEKIFIFLTIKNL